MTTEFDSTHIPPESQANGSTLAPSEKHLEDWIVANLSLFGEDARINIRRLVARQPQFPSGRPDLILAIQGSVSVVELKKDRADGRAVAQVLRYLGDIRMIHDYNNEGQFSHTYSAYEYPMGRPIVHGIIVAKSFDDNAYLACINNNIDMLSYEYDGEDYYFNDAENECGGSWTSLLGTDTEYAINEVIRHLYLLDNDRETLKEIYRQEGWIK